MKRLSVIIVNYNVKYFLEQALYAVKQAGKNLNPEVIIVDNASSDSSVEMLKEKFPEFKLIVNQQNTGFAKANNMAIRQATGKYILLLNPDTLIAEDTFDKIIRFMDSHPDAGGLGVKMIDGKGNYLPESKRAFPKPWISFFKAFGFTNLFPHSKLFARYYLGHLSEKQVQEVEVLAGAFMLIRRSVLEKTGLLDEQFFMYGEDIDLSYRIIKAGFKNYYYPDTQIVHYKGESTKKGSLNYVKMFYNAMVIFTEKHFGKSKAGWFRLFVKMAIWFRAVLSLLFNISRKIWPVLADAIVLYGGIYYIKLYWETHIKEAPAYYPVEFMLYVVPAYISIWLISVYFSGGYDKNFSVSKSIRGILAGTLIISAFYGFMNESYRFSRAIILLGAAWAGLEIIISRALWHLLTSGKISSNPDAGNRLLIVGKKQECERVINLLSRAGINHTLLGFIGPESGNDYLAAYDEFEKTIKIFNATEIIFCLNDIKTGQCISLMQTLHDRLAFKTIVPGSESIIGSNSKNNAGDLYALDLNLAIEQASNKRNKRMMDIGLCLLMIPFFPLGIFFIKDYGRMLKNWVLVLIGKISWVSYTPDIENTQILPGIKKGILHPDDPYTDLKPNSISIQRLNRMYAKDYSAWQDFAIFRKAFRQLGRKAV